MALSRDPALRRRVRLHKEVLPGASDDLADDTSKADPDLEYKSRWGVQDDELEEVVHRSSEAEAHVKRRTLRKCAPLRRHSTIPHDRPLAI